MGPERIRVAPHLLLVHAVRVVDDRPEHSANHAPGSNEPKERRAQTGPVGEPHEGWEALRVGGAGHDDDPLEGARALMHQSKGGQKDDATAQGMADEREVSEVTFLDEPVDQLGLVRGGVAVVVGPRSSTEPLEVDHHDVSARREPGRPEPP